ncbi:hypothetical protein [Halobaculum sp. D14]|uniref:hypothetical protein n=1 Tax=Halobaculum sp. D14 TaxID=3421642 RepID=UPI003EBA7F44
MRTDLSKVNAAEHYRQRAQRLETNEALFGGVLLGVATCYLGLLVWQVVARE